MTTSDGSRIAYVGRVLPALSETFVVREAAALMQLGVPVELFSIYPPSPSHHHPELPDAARRARVIYRPRTVDFWKAHCQSHREHPGRYRLAIQDFILDPRESPGRRVRSTVHFLMAPYAAALLKRYAVSHVHAHFANVAASIAMMAAHLAGVPFSFTVHAYDLFVDDILMEEKLRRARFIATCSRFHVDYLRRHYPGAVDARIEVIHYGIDPARFPRAKRPAVNGPVFLGVGRLVETKGFHTLIETCSVLNERGMSATCVIVGAGVEEARLKRLASQKGLADKVSFTGALQPADILKWYDRAHCLVMPSCVRNNDRDGMPNVLIEAMARGLPVISTRVSGIPELVRDGETGLLVEPDRPLELADAMAAVARDRGLAERLGRAGRELVLAEYDIHRSARRLRELFTTSARVE
jgi:glycosyltransferase involved in cell wall biosynthesis